MAVRPGDLPRLRLWWWFWHASSIIGAPALVGEDWYLPGDHFGYARMCDGNDDAAAQEPVLAMIFRANEGVVDIGGRTAIIYVHVGLRSLK